MRYSSSTHPVLRSSILATGLTFAALVLVLVTAISLATQVWLYWAYPELPVIPLEKTLAEYSYISDDYPQYYPIDLGDVSLTPENTIHYQIFTEDASREWESIFPPGGGFVYLGPEQRPFGLALFHQMHCLARIRRAMNLRQSSEHVHHCFNYIRQAILCEANPTIEPVIPILGRRSVNAEIPRTCRDWTQVYDLATAHFRNASAVAGGGRAEGAARPELMYV